MAHLAACLLALALLPAAALKPQPIPTPGPAPLAEEPPPPLTARLPIAQRERYEVFVQKCGRCHTPEKALGVSYSAPEWDEYLKKKYRRAGAGITPGQMEQIGAFLRYWATAPR
jgi:mono/diheme cytochrome c family protein